MDDDSTTTEPTTTAGPEITTDDEDETTPPEEQWSKLNLEAEDEIQCDMLKGEVSITETFGNIK